MYLATYVLRIQHRTAGLEPSYTINQRGCAIVRDRVDRKDVRKLDRLSKTTTAMYTRRHDTRVEHIRRRYDTGEETPQDYLGRSNRQTGILIRTEDVYMWGIEGSKDKQKANAFGNIVTEPARRCIQTRLRFTPAA